MKAYSATIQHDGEEYYITTFHDKLGNIEDFSINYEGSEIPEGELREEIKALIEKDWDEIFCQS